MTRKTLLDVSCKGFQEKITINTAVLTDIMKTTIYILELHVGLLMSIPAVLSSLGGEKTNWSVNRVWHSHKICPYMYIRIKFLCNGWDNIVTALLIASHSANNSRVVTEFI